MLVLCRREGQWTLIHDKEGRPLRIRAVNIEGPTDGFPGQVDLVFDDPARNFEIERPERRKKMVSQPGRAEPGGVDAAQQRDVPDAPDAPDVFDEFSVALAEHARSARLTYGVTGRVRAGSFAGRPGAVAAPVLDEHGDINGNI